MNEPPITNYLAYLLAQANRQMSAQLTDALAEEGVQIEHWRILEVLSDEHGRSMGELAELVLMNHPALTKTIDRMVSSGFVLASDPEQLEHIVAKLDSLVVKAANESGGHGMLIGPNAGERELEKFRRRIVADPRNYIAQPVVPLSRHPTFVPDAAG